MSIKRFLYFTVIVLFALGFQASAQTDPLDAKALQDLYRTLNIPSQLKGWKTDGGDPCVKSWTGVTCNGSSVIHLIIPGLQLGSNLGFQLSNLHNLKQLYISSNHIQGEIPYNLPANVTHLNLADNNFSQNMPYSLTNMKHLRHLGNGGAELLLSREDRSSYMDMYASSSYSTEQDRRRFAVEDLNIIDPLKENNNLGGRVNRGWELHLDMEAVKNSNLVDLSGDYASLARNYAHGRCTLGFCATLPTLIRTFGPQTIAHQNIRWSIIWNMERNAAAEGQFVYTENSDLRRIGSPYFPDPYSNSFREGSYYPPPVNLMQEPS